jgi:hypothetical protein
MSAAEAFLARVKELENDLYNAPTDSHAFAVAESALGFEIVPKLRSALEAVYTEIGTWNIEMSDWGDAIIEVIERELGGDQ